MKLTPINRNHIIEAGNYIDRNGIPDDNRFNNYWVELPNGKEYPFKYLVRTAYRLTPGNSDFSLDFQSNELYRNYVEYQLRFPIHYYKEGVNFFTIEDIEHFQKLGGEKYRKADKDNVREGQLLKPLVYKVNKWAEKSLIENFLARPDYHWQWSGTFKPYLWIRLYRSGASRKVFFVLGATSDGGLYYKIDCVRSTYTGSETLSVDRQQQFDSYLAETDYNPVYIDKVQLTKLDWDKLTEQTTRFFYQFAPIYDELENLINSNERVIDKQVERFVEVSVPPKIKTNLEKARTFAGYETDWSQKQACSKRLGDAGEHLVLEFEKEKLIRAGLREKADLVCKQKDGSGYDILSYDLNGIEIHIEVKTTTGKENEPFYFSINEKDYVEAFPSRYFLYRLYNFRFDPSRAKYFVLSGTNLLAKATFRSTNFEVSMAQE